MTTESKTAVTRPFHEWTEDEIAAESRQNREYWLEHQTRIAEEFPCQWVIVYDGGTVIGFSDPQEYFEFLFSLDDKNQRCRFKAPVPRRNGTFRMSSAHQHLT